MSAVLRGALGNVAREALKNVGDVTPTPSKSKSGPLSGAKGIAAGMGLAAAAPLAKKGVDAMRGNGKVPGKPGGLAAKAASMAGDSVGSKLKDAVSEKVDEAGGAGGLVKEAAGGLLPFGGGGDDGPKGKGGTPGVGKGRRMPVQQAVDVAVPIETAYNQWTQYEDWAQFMHRITNVSQGDDPSTVNFSAKIWTRKRDFEAKIITQRPDERIKWRVAQGITHTGVVTFHELAPRLTRVELTMDVDPGSMIEKIARGARHIKRAIRADLHRYKAFIEMLEHETGAWRGVIEDGDVVEDHDPSYDDKRDYAEVDDLYDEAEEIDASQQDEEDEEDDEDEKDDDEQQNGNGGGRERTQRFQRQAERSRTAAASRGGSSRSTSSGGGSGRSSGSSSGGSGRSKSSSSGSRSKSSSSGSSSRSRPAKGSSSSGRSRSGKSKSSGSKSSASRRKSTSRS